MLNEESSSDLINTSYELALTCFNKADIHRVPQEKRLYEIWRNAGT